MSPRVCAKSGSTCSKKGLKAELRRRKFSKSHLARLAHVSVKKADGSERTKKTLISLIVNSRKARGVARLLGLTLAGKRHRSSRKGGKGKCRYKRKKTGRKGCKKKPGPKRGRRTRRRYKGGVGGSLHALKGRRKRTVCRNIWA